MIRMIFNWKKIIASFAIIFLAQSTQALTINHWHPILSLGLGTATVTNLGQSKNFPIQNPVTDEFYNYSDKTSTQTSTLAAIFIGMESALYPNWLVQAGLNYNQTSPYTAKGVLVQGADLGSADTYTYHYRAQLKQLLAQGKLLYTFKNIYHPYVLGGIGASFNKAYNYSTNIPFYLAFTRMYKNNSSTSLSYALGFGIDFDINANLRAGVGYQFADLGKVGFDRATISSTTVSGGLSRSNVYSNQLLAQLTFII